MSETETEAETPATEPKKVSIPNDAITALITGIPHYEKASFVVVGHRNGVRLALPKTNGVSRAYFYGNGDYSLLPTHPAILVFTEEQRKARRLGGIMAEVDFDAGLDAASEALAALVEVVRNAEAPAPKGVKAPKEPKAPRKAKAKAEATDTTGAPPSADGN